MNTLKQLQEKGEEEFRNKFFNIVLDNGGKISEDVLAFLHQQTTLAYQSGRENEREEIKDKIKLFSDRYDTEILDDLGESSPYPAPCSRKTCNLLIDILSTLTPNTQ